MTTTPPLRTLEVRDASGNLKRSLMTTRLALEIAMNGFKSDTAKKSGFKPDDEANFAETGEPDRWIKLDDLRSDDHKELREDLAEELGIDLEEYSKKTPPAAEEKPKKDWTWLLWLIGALALAALCGWLLMNYGDSFSNQDGAPPDAIGSTDPSDVTPPIAAGGVDLSKCAGRVEAIEYLTSTVRVTRDCDPSKGGVDEFTAWELESGKTAPASCFPPGHNTGDTLPAKDDCPDRKVVATGRAVWNLE